MSTQRAGNRPRVVPLEAGAGPENPPCPACGEPLFGWLATPPGRGEPARRCESCGLGMLGEPDEAADALLALDRLTTDGALRVENRASLSAWLGGAGWAGLRPGVRYLFTVEAVRRLVASRDQVVADTRWLPGRGVPITWQTLLNSATFGHNVALEPALRAGRTWQRRIDWITTAVLAVPAFALALVLETAGVALRRGSVVSLRLQSL